MSRSRLRRSPRGAVSTPDRAATHPPGVAAATPRGRILGNGRYWTLLTSSGTGGAWLGDEALTSWRGDRVEDADGWFVYLRDLEGGVFWSLGRQPVPAVPEAYRTEDGPGWLAIERHDHGMASRMDAWVDPDDSAECRRITLHNRTAHPRALDLTSYLEVVLLEARHHAAHPAFSKLFVQTEFVAERRVLLAHRRPRSPDERHAWLAHAVLGPGPASHETDRGRFLGRGRGPAAPLALVSREPLSGTVGDVLDPVFAVRRVVELPAGATVRLDLLLAAGSSREEVLAIVDRLSHPGSFDASRDRGQSLASSRALAHGVSLPKAERLERLAAAVLYREPGLAAGAGASAGARPDGRSPIVPAAGPLVMVEAETPAMTVDAARTAQAYWRALGLSATLAIVSAERPRSTAQEPGVIELAAADLDARTLAGLRAQADLILFDRMPEVEPDPGRPATGPAAGAVAGAPSKGRAPGPPRTVAIDGSGDGTATRVAGDGAIASAGEEPLRCFNGFGGFSARGDEYVIRMPPGPFGAPRLTPRPWVNVLANPSFGALISESGAGCTWSRNSREFRLTPWSNDPVRDPHDEALYLRDEASGLLWSAFAGPVPGEGPYEMRHGFGTSRCRHASGGIEVETDVFVHASDPVKIVRLRIANRGTTARRLAVVSYQRLVLGHAAEGAARAVTTWADEAEGILFARTDGPPEYADAVVFAAAVGPESGARLRIGTDRMQILGPGGSPMRPAALLAGSGPDGRTGRGFDPCFCQELKVEIGPGDSRTCAFLLGESPVLETIAAIVARLRRPGAIEAARDEVTSAWAERLGRMRVETPVESLDLLANGWLAYQALACRLWARTAFYQSGGAYGFRDQLQDACAFLATEPAIARDQILLHCAHQFVQGDVLHWWHPPRGAGIRTRFADDLLWLPLATAWYVRATGDRGLLDETAPFLSARALEPSEDEAFLTPLASGETADVYEHCCRALDRSLATGAHGLPLFGSGDWNDGMNRVGRGGRGESVWMAFFLDLVIGEFLPLCEGRGDLERARRLQAHQGHLREAVKHTGWDGGWYRRGYFDDGSPLGSRESDECRIDALVQAWSVLSGAAPRARCEAAMDAVARELIEPDGLIRLLTPPFDRTPRDPGYIKGYVPGVRENGGQYTHAALWVIAAMARLGRSEEAARLLEAASPITRAGSERAAQVYQVEPYVLAADVYTNPLHHDRGGWTWYTGSAGWMLRVILESVLGVSLEAGRTLVVRAAIPASWPGYRLGLRPWGREGIWELEVRNTSSLAAEVVGVTLDGRGIPPSGGVARIPLEDDGLGHRVEIELR